LPSARDFQRQINTVKNQARVFSALQTVSSVKFRKAEARVRRARPYAENVEQMMRDVASNATGEIPLLTGREVRRVAVCTLTADRGLAGGFNAQVLRRTIRLREEKDPGALQVASGRKGVAFFRFRRVELAEVFTGFTDNPTYENAREIGRALTRLFDDEEADEARSQPSPARSP
jgi:F-type H+-transporting ATPase subunit gamma